MSFGPGQFCNQRKHFPLPLVDSNPRPRIRTRDRVSDPGALTRSVTVAEGRWEGVGRGISVTFFQREKEFSSPGRKKEEKWWFEMNILRWI